MDVPRDVTMNWKRPSWLHDTFQYRERHATLSGTFRERQIPHKFLSYMELMSNIIDSKPSNYNDVAGR